MALDQQVAFCLEIGLAVADRAGMFGNIEWGKYLFTVCAIAYEKTYYYSC